MKTVKWWLVLFYININVINGETYKNKKKSSIPKSRPCKNDMKHVIDCNAIIIFLCILQLPLYTCF